MKRRNFSPGAAMADLGTAASANPPAGDGKHTFAHRAGATDSNARGDRGRQGIEAMGYGMRLQVATLACVVASAMASPALAQAVINN